MIRIAVAVAAMIGLAGCANQPTATTGGSPALSEVGQGLAVARKELPAAFVAPEIRARNSLWSQSNHGVFRDLRAHKVGDIVTVAIDIDDKAQFDNSSGHSKEGNAQGSIAYEFGFGGFGMPEQSGSAAGTLDGSGSVSAKGEGKIDRSEKLTLSIAAVVSEVLPDGNLLIGGSQEVRVNHEVRVLTIAGIVRPVDIDGRNSIPYDKIAEARISYGGRGAISAVQ